MFPYEYNGSHFQLWKPYWFKPKVEIEWGKKKTTNPVGQTVQQMLPSLYQIALTILIICFSAVPNSCI